MKKLFGSGNFSNISQDLAPCSHGFFQLFSRNDASGKRFREAEGEASPQSPPAGALLLKKKEKKYINYLWIVCLSQNPCLTARYLTAAHIAAAYGRLKPLILGFTGGLITIGVSWAIVRPARATVLFGVLSLFYAFASVGKGAYDVYHGEAFAADDAVLPPPTSFGDGLYTSAVVATPLSAYTPTIFFGVCSLVSAVLAVRECIKDAKFEKAAKADLAALARPKKKGAELL